MSALTLSPRPTRARLLSLLSEACELEHGLACSYLYAAFSLKRDPEDGLDWQDTKLLRYWAAQLYFVASQEMLHLAQVWNLLNAVGGTPWWSHPPFPQAKGFFPIQAELSLEGYSPPTLARFIAWERPRPLPDQGPGLPMPAKPSTHGWGTVGELYDRILEHISALDDGHLFIGNTSSQVGPELAHFPDLTRVHDQQSAAEAIRRIQHQGESTPTARPDCHHGIFTALAIELDAWRKTHAVEPAFTVAANPSWRVPLNGSSPATLLAMRFFDDLYELMLRMLAWIFSAPRARPEQIAALAQVAIQLMPTVIEPLGRLLTRLPLVDSQRGGAAFSLGRTIALPADGGVALRLVAERLADLRDDALMVVEQLPDQAIVVRVQAILEDFHKQIIKNL